MDWPEGELKNVVDHYGAYPEDKEEFAGLFGYNITYLNCRFIKDSNNYLFISEFKG
jgi:hypothetical protein